MKQPIIPYSWQNLNFKFIPQNTNFFYESARYLSVFDYSNESTQTVNEYRPTDDEIKNMKYAYFNYYPLKDEDENYKITDFQITEDLLYIIVSKYLISKESQKKK